MRERAIETVRERERERESDEDTIVLVPRGMLLLMRYGISGEKDE